MVFISFVTSGKKRKALANQYFRFKQFTIYQEKTAMKVGTDGVLLGAWANINQAEKVLDVGTGTGLIAIMMAQRSSGKIHAIETKKKAYQQAKENINNCPWADRIQIHHTSFQDYVLHTNCLYDLIVSNPPYFGDSLSPPAKDREQARHTKTLSHDDLIKGSLKILNYNGLLSVILPYREGCSFIRLAENNGLYCIRKTYVKPNPNKNPKRLLLEFSYHPGEPAENHLVIEKSGRHDFTKEYRMLTGDFYLYF